MNYYQELHEALDALRPRRLITGHFYLNGCFCAVGALRNARTARGEDSVKEGDYGHVSLNGLTAHENDGFKGTEEERHAHMLAYAARKMV